MDDPLDPIDEPVRDAPAPFSMWLVMLAVPAFIVAARLVLPHTPVVVGLLALLALTAVFLGVWRVLSLQRLHQPPGRHPAPPPS